MALVITNLFSAIPFIGKDIVLWLWGGFLYEGPYYSNIVWKKSVLCWNIFIWIINYYIIKLLYIIWKKNNIVKILIIKRQSAVINNIFITQRLKKFNFKKYPPTGGNKLNTDDPIYAYIVGLFEGDGWISISKKGKYLLYEIGIEINIRDIQLIYKIKKILGIGIISIKKRKNKDGLIKELVRYNIRNKDHLINIIIPIFDKYPIITNKYNKYLYFKENLLNNIKYYEDLSFNNSQPHSPCTSIHRYEVSGKYYNNNIENILNKKYLSAWLIGFIEAEGCFSIYNNPPKGGNPPGITPLYRGVNPGGNNNIIASFEISQLNNKEVIEAIRIYLKINQNIYLDKFNNSRILLKSIKGIENIIKFIKKNPIKLIGYKRLQYLLFLKKLRLIPKYYNNINIPQIY